MKKVYKNKLPKNTEVSNIDTEVVNGEVVVTIELKDRFQPKDGDFLIDADGDIFIYSDAKTQNSNFYSCYCGTQHGKIRAAFCYNWVDKNGCRFATPEEKDAFIIRLEKEYHKCWNAEKKELEIVRWRACYGEPYYYIDSSGNVRVATDYYTSTDNERYEVGNYCRFGDELVPYAKQVKEIYKKLK